MNEFSIGIDAGGTKTDLVLADLGGEILKKVTVGPANLRNFGVENSCKNILKGVEKIKPKKGEIVSTFVGLPAVYEEYSNRKEDIKNILSQSIPGDLKIGSDQLVAFRSGTDKNQGLVVIAGTGGVVRGFGKKREKVSGWGYFADEGSAFWVGIKAYQKITKDLDNRGDRTLITKLAFKNLGVENGNDLNSLIYKNPMKEIPGLSVFVDYASRKGDKQAIEILKEASEELFLGIKTVVKKLDLQEKKFPLVIVGGMFKSEILFDDLSLKIDKLTKGADIIKPEKKPIFGAVKLALENYEKK